MSDRVSGHPSRSRLATRVALLLGVLGVVAGPAAPLVGAAGGVTVTTPFPAVVAEPGSSATFKLALDVPTAQRVDLKADGVPSGWTARFRGGGSVVDGAYVDPKTPPDVTLSVDDPQGRDAPRPAPSGWSRPGPAAATRSRSRSASPRRPRATSP